MNNKYVVCNRKEKEYISAESILNLHYVITSIEAGAYIFEERELERAHFIADVWDMEVLETSPLVKL